MGIRSHHYWSNEAVIWDASADWPDWLIRHQPIAIGADRRRRLAEAILAANPRMGGKDAALKGGGATES